MEWDGALNGAWDGAYRSLGWEFYWGLGWGLSGLGMGVLLGFLYINKFDFVG